MKNVKKFLVFLPAVFCLTSCGENVGIPGGYSKLDVKNKEAVGAYCDKFAENVGKTYKAALSGVEISGHVVASKITSYDYSIDKEIDGDNKKVTDESSKNIEVKNFNLDYKFRAANLDKEFNEWKVLFEVRNVKGDFKVSTDFLDDEDNISLGIKARDVDFGLYLTGGSLYLDLADKGLKNLAHDAIGEYVKMMYGDDDDDAAELISEFRAVAELATEKYYIDDVEGLIQSFFEDDDKLILKGMPEEETGPEEEQEPEHITLPTELDEEMLEAAKDEMDTIISLTQEVKIVSDNITFADYKDSKLAVGFDGKYKNQDVFEPEEGSKDYTKIDGRIRAALNFDNKGRFKSFGLTADAKFNEYSEDNSQYNEGYSKTDAEIKGLGVSMNARYGIKSVSMPNFKDYKKLPLKLIMAR